MNRSHKKTAEWMLERQRFHLSDPVPPPETRPERTIGPILSDILKTEKPQESLPEAAYECWRIAVGAQIARHTVPDSVQNGKLLVNVDHPGWLTEIRRLSTQSIIKKLNATRSLPELREIRFRLDPNVRTRTYRKKIR